MSDLNYSHMFFPQLLYNFKFYNEYTLGGSIVAVKKEYNNLFKKNENNWYTIDIALFIPLTKFLTSYKRVEELKIGIGVFITDIDSNASKPSYLPTYSIDTKFKIFH